MSAKKKNQTKNSKSKTTAAGKKRVKKKAATKKPAANKKKVAKKKPRKAAARKIAGSSKAKSTKAARSGKREVLTTSPTSGEAFTRAGLGADYAGQSGSLQGLSRRERSDSESVDELLEEGNTFEADAISGVEEAENDEERPVHTHEVPEDDVPEEYLERDE